MSIIVLLSRMRIILYSSPCRALGLAPWVGPCPVPYRCAHSQSVQRRPKRRTPTVAQRERPTAVSVTLNLSVRFCTSRHKNRLNLSSSSASFYRLPLRSSACITSALRKSHTGGPSYLLAAGASRPRLVLIAARCRHSADTPRLYRYARRRLCPSTAPRPWRRTANRQESGQFV